MTGCATFQLPAVNVNIGVDATPSAALSLASVMTTLAAGWLVSVTVKLAVPPDSLVTRPAVGVTLTPAASSSELEAATSAAFMPL